MTVRLATSLDALAIAAVRTPAWQAAYRGILPPAYLARLERTLARAWPEGTWVAEDERGELAGYLSSTSGHPALPAPAPELVEIQELYVDPRRWRRGIGGELLAVALASFAARGAREAFLWVLEANLGARRFYETQRFRLAPPGKLVRVEGASIPAVRYVRRLAVAPRH